MKEFLEAVAGAAMITGLIAFYCWATPDQLSAEADLTAEVAE